MSPEVRRPLNQVHFKKLHRGFLNQPVKYLIRQHHETTFPSHDCKF